jgi:N-acetylmuramoyl-L-alanine amidase
MAPFHIIYKKRNGEYMKNYGFAIKLLGFGLCLIFVFYVFMQSSGAPVSSQAVIGLIKECDVTSGVCVLIDPGHGGADGGASSDSGILEKNINLDISQKLYAVLKTLGIRCEMTRYDDIMLDGGASSHKKMHDLKNRVLASKQYGNCVFVSIHQNKFPQKKYSGTQVYYSKNDPASETLAKLIQSSVCENLQPENTRQIKKATSSIYILDNINCPAVLTECGFLSNDNEAVKLTEQSYQKQLACAITAGIVKFLAVQTAQGE